MTDKQSEIHSGVGDFNFLAGHWKISHRKLKEHWVGSDEWDVFEGEATCWSALGGIASIEELRIPSRGFSGLGIRLLDVGKRVWCDYWVSGRDGLLVPPPTTGVFENGVGTFIADDADDKSDTPPMKSRGIWDRITPTSARWYQSFSRDGGATWEDDWLMDWVRVSV